jgi:hypothetical protein
MATGASVLSTDTTMTVRVKTLTIWLQTPNTYLLLIATEGALGEAGCGISSQRFFSATAASSHSLLGGPLAPWHMACTEQEASGYQGGQGAAGVTSVSRRQFSALKVREQNAPDRSKKANQQ